MSEDYDVVIQQEFNHQAHEARLFKQCAQGVKASDLVLPVVDGAEMDAEGGA